jgi:hypothetical protein
MLARALRLVLATKIDPYACGVIEDAADTAWFLGKFISGNPSEENQMKKQLVPALLAAVFAFGGTSVYAADTSASSQTGTKKTVKSVGPHAGGTAPCTPEEQAKATGTVKCVPEASAKEPGRSGDPASPEKRKKQ